jgi:hypothetical protein
MKEIGKYGNVIFIQAPDMGNLTFWAGGNIDEYFLLGGGRIKKNITPTEKFTSIPLQQHVNAAYVAVPANLDPATITWIAGGTNDQTHYMQALQMYSGN